MNIHEVYAMFSRRFRRRRMAEFARVFAVTNNTTIIDVGGAPAVWEFLDAEPQVLLVNVDEKCQSDQMRGNLRFARGDGRHLESVSDLAYDIAFSNSVIEHVGHKEDREAFATEVRRVGKSYYVQTPSSTFPIEPHLLSPFVHWLPRRVQEKVIRHWTIWGLVAKPTPADIERFLDGTELLSFREFKALFPDAEIIRERFLGMTKSYIAVRLPRRG